MPWSVAQAKQRLSEVIRLSGEEPQRIYNRGQLVAAVIDARTLERLEAAERAAPAPTLGEEFAGLRELCAGEEYELDVPLRAEAGRANAFAWMLDEEQGKEGAPDAP